MQTLRTLLLVLTAALFSIPGAASAADIAFFPVEAPNVAPQDAIAIGEILAQSYASVSGQAVLAPSRIQLLTPNYQQASTELGVAEYVRTDAVALGGRIVIHAVRYKADGTAIFQVKMTAERVEDMSAVSDRMARALYMRVDDEEVRTRHNVTLSEARPEARRWTEKVTGVKTSLHLPVAKNADYAPSVSAMFDMRLESNRFFIEFGAGLMLSPGIDEYCDSYDYDSSYSSSSCKKNQGSISALAAEMGASYFLTDGNVAPYVGGGVLPRIIMADDVVGLAFYGQVGLMLPRDSSTRFYVDARIAQNALALKLDNGHERHPTELSLQAGIGW